MHDHHPILKRQLKKHFGGIDRVPESLSGFISLIDDAYRAFDEDRRMLERSLELTSDEMRRANNGLSSIGRRLEKQNEMLMRIAGGAGEDSSLFSEIAETASRTLESDVTSIWLFDGEDGEPCRKAEYKRNNMSAAVDFNLSPGAWNLLVNKLETDGILAVNTATDGLLRSLSRDNPEFRTITAMLCAPVRRRDRIIGLLINLWSGGGASRDHDEQQFAASLADIIAIIVERKGREAAERDLLELREQELSLLRAIPHGVVGLENRKIIIANDSMKQVFGWLPEELIGKSTRLLYRSDEDNAAIAALFYPVLTTISTHTEIFPCRKKDGTEIMCRVSAARIGGSLTDLRIVVVYEDITESINASLTLEINKRFAENLLHSIEVPAFVIDNNHRVLMWNTACEHMTGLQAGQVVGTDLHWKAFYDQQRPTLADIVIDGQYGELPSLYQFYSRSLFIENSWHGEGWYDGLGGARRYMLFDAVPIYDEKGDLVAAIETLQDISILKSAEEALRDSENRYRAIFESTGTAMLMIDEDTTVSLTNTEFQRITGYGREEIEGNMSWTVFVSPDDLIRMKTYHDMRRSGNGEAPQAYDFHLLCRNGETREMFLTITMIPGTKKSVASLIDITQMKETERQMERMRFYLQNIIDSMPSMIIGLNRDGTITQWNRAAREETGLQVESALGRPLADALPWFSPLIDSVHRAMEERSEQKIERMPRHSEESIRYVDVMVYPLFWNEVEGAVVRIDDVTKRVRIDEMIIQTEKMISVGGLAAGMAHEINNPLSGILMSVENISRRITPGLVKNSEVAAQCGMDFSGMQEYMEKREVYRMLDAIREMGIRAAMIVSNMLSFSRMSSSRPAPINLKELADRTLALAEHDYDLKKKYDFRHIEIVKEYPDGPIEIMCISTEIEQVLLNLLRNAAQEMMLKDYGGDRPGITLRLMNCEAGVRIEVEDNGPGMNESVRKRVFEPFFTTKEPGVGTGLGLSVSYFIVTNNHRGTMSVESEPGKGAKFIVEIPRQ